MAISIVDAVESSSLDGEELARLRSAINEIIEIIDFNVDNENGVRMIKDEISSQLLGRIDEIEKGEREYDTEEKGDIELLVLNSKEQNIG